MTPTIRSRNRSGSGSPVNAIALRCSSSIPTTGSPASSSLLASSGRLGLTAIPWSVTSTPIDSPGVITVVTLLTTVGRRPRTSGATTIARFAAAATSQWPPDAPRNTPSDPVMTLTLKSRSISSAARITTSMRSTYAPFDVGFAYSLAEISMCALPRRSDSAASLSNDCTSINVLIRSLACRSAMPPVMPPRAKLAVMPFSAIFSPRKRVAAIDDAPDPVCIEKPSPKVAGMLHHVGRQARDQQLPRVLGGARRALADERRIADVVQVHDQVDVVLRNAGRMVRERHELRRQQNDRAGVLGVDLGVAERPADQLALRAAGVAELVAAGHAEERHVDLQLAALQQVHPSAMRVDLHRPRQHPA